MADKGRRKEGLAKMEAQRKGKAKEVMEHRRKGANDGGEVRRGPRSPNTDTREAIRDLGGSSNIETLESR